MLGVGGRAGVSLAKEVEGPEHVEDEDGRPAGEEEEHDQDEHVDHLPCLLLSLRDLGVHAATASLLTFRSVFLFLQIKEVEHANFVDNGNFAVNKTPTTLPLVTYRRVTLRNELRLM